MSQDMFPLGMCISLEWGGGERLGVDFMCMEMGICVLKGPLPIACWTNSYDIAGSACGWNGKEFGM